MCDDVSMETVVFREREPNGIRTKQRVIDSGHLWKNYINCRLGTTIGLDFRADGVVTGIISLGSSYVRKFLGLYSSVFLVDDTSFNFLIFMKRASHSACKCQAEI